LNISSEVNPPELKFRERFYYDAEREGILNRYTDLSIYLPKIHGYLLGLKSIKTLIVSFQKKLNLHAIISTIWIIDFHEKKIVVVLYFVEKC